MGEPVIKFRNYQPKTELDQLGAETVEKAAVPDVEEALQVCRRQYTRGGGGMLSSPRHAGTRRLAARTSRTRIRPRSRSSTSRPRR